MFRFPSVICTRCTGFFCLAIIKGPPNDIYCIIEEPYKHYFTEKVSYSQEGGNYMLNIDAKGILKNTGRITPIFPGIRPTTMIKKNCMTTSVLSFDSAVSLNKSIPASITFISPKHYANILWLNKCLDIYEGPRVIGTFIVTEITNPILDANAEKWIFIDGRDIHTLNDFFDQIEQKLTSKIDFKIGRNMNAFSDLLWGGFGIHEYAEPLHIVWIYSTQSRKALGNKYFDTIISIIENHESNNKYLELYDEHIF